MDIPEEVLEKAFDTHDEIWEIDRKAAQVVAEWARKQTLIDVSDALTDLPDPDAERDGVLRSKLRIGKMLTDMMLGESR